MVIRKFTDEDAKAASNIIKECFLKMDIGGHTTKGIEMQIKSNLPENLIKKSETVKYYVAVEDDKIIGICGYDREKVHTFFVDVKCQNKGAGKKLLTKILDEVKNKKIKSIKTWSTIYALKFYESFGFKRIKEIILPEGGNEIVLIEMGKKII
ncbi:MAG: GNAT family N-acetyltransferase [Spirochaetes bacterium]|nr:GNAT family N-acetyltransferase [Spirochaetota bacterium]